MNIREAHEKFATDEQCLQYIEKMRWPDGIVRCPTCGDANVEKYDRPLPNPRKRRSKKRDAEKENKRQWFYICRNADCREQFSPTSGTIFHDTHLPLITWFQAITLILNAKKGISALQLQRDLGIGGYKTAWYLNHRIREVMGDDNIPKLGGIVEIDELYIGGKSTHAKKWTSKDCVIGMRQRKGPLRLVQVERPRLPHIMKAIEAHVSPDVKWIVTDEAQVYQFKNTQYKDAAHLRINHRAKQYVRGNVHTNTVESAFSLLRRGIIGSFHQVSIKHLQRYLNEFAYRFNRRNDDGMFLETVRRLCGFKPLPFATLTSDPAPDVPF